MPELPDLQVFSANLTKAIAGKKVAKLSVPVPDKLNVSVAVAQKEIEHHTVKKVLREGKELQILFSNDKILALHLMLHGGLNLFEGKNDHKHTILELLFDDNTGLALTDWQKIATPTLDPEPKTAPDALSEDIN